MFTNNQNRGFYMISALFGAGKALNQGARSPWRWIISGLPLWRRFQIVFSILVTCVANFQQAKDFYLLSLWIAYNGMHC